VTPSKAPPLRRLAFPLGAVCEDFAKDLRYGVRMLRQSPAFTTTAVLTLALGIGASAAVFSIVDAVILHPFAYSDPDRLVAVHDVYISKGLSAKVTPGNYFDYKTQSTSFTSLAMDFSAGQNYVINKEPVRLLTENVTANFFPTLGVQPMLGRGFREEDAAGNRSSVAILAYNTWRDSFGSRREIIGQTIRSDDQVFTVIGVMSPSFQAFKNSLAGPALYLPIMDWSGFRQDRRWRFMQVIGRLKSGVSPGQAAGELNRIASRLGAQFPDTNQGWGATVIPLLDDTVDFARPLLYTLFGAVLALVLIACVNIANLLLARAASRQKEMVLRAALGASRGRIVRQLLCESILLAALGGALGVLLAYWSAGLIISILPGDLPNGANVSLNGKTLIVVCAAVLLAGIGSGLAPALQASRQDFGQFLKDRGRGLGNAKRGGLLRNLFVITQISLAIILLVSAGLLVRSFVGFHSVDRGYQSKDLYRTPIGLFDKKYSDPTQQIVFVDQVLEKVSHLHGVRSAAFSVNALDFQGTAGFQVFGQPVLPAGSSLQTRWQIVTPDYFKTLGIRLLRGRLFTEHDTSGTTPVILINDAMARRFFPNINPIGQRLKVSFDNGWPAEWKQIIGIVNTVRFEAEDTGNSSFETVYFPYRQFPVSLLALGISMQPGVPLDIHAVSRAVHSVDPGVPLTVMFGHVLDVRGTPGIRRLSMLFSTAFACAALLLAAIGIYGVMAYTVSQRTGEIGVRMALGAQRSDVLRLVLNSGTRMILVGILFGLLGAVASTRLLETLLFNIDARDFSTFAGIAATVSLVAFIACLVPALRATRVNPVVALRAE